MNERPPGIRRVCIAVDVDRPVPHRPGVLRPRKWRRDLATVLDDVCYHANMDRAHWDLPSAGGGELALLPPGIDEGRVVAAFVRELVAELSRLNLFAPESDRVRLRVAMHQGITHVDESGFSGRAVVKTRWLRDCDFLRRALTNNPGAELALAVTAELFDDVVEHEYPELRGRDFSPARLSLPGGGGADIWFILIRGEEAQGSLDLLGEPGATRLSGLPRAPHVPGPSATRHRGPRLVMVNGLGEGGIAADVTVGHPGLGDILDVRRSTPEDD